MKYAVTYCVLDHEFNGNFFWHSCILLSRWDEGGKIEVINNWGFYGVPSTSHQIGLGKLQIKLGLDIDLKGNHGMLRHEDLRFLDLGLGLHGVTFELTKEKFELLQDKCETLADEQEKAIMEVVEEEGIEAKVSNKTRIYRYEDHSRHIYQQEKIKAQAQGRLPRLKPFEINLSFTMWGPALNQSHTCKSQIISLLDGILSPQQITRLTEKGKHPTVPRYSGVLERIYLHSSGPLRQHQTSSGAIIHYRDLQDPGVKLHWTLAPQEIETWSEDTNNTLRISEEYCDEVKQVVGRLQRLEWLFYNAELPIIYKRYQTNLINRIHDCYEAFSQPESKKANAKSTGWKAYGLSLFSLPRDQYELSLLQKLEMAKHLFNSLYMAVAEGWKIYDDCLPETEQLLEDNEGVIDDDYPHFNPLEALSAYLSVNDKIKLCSIIGRTYDELSPDELRLTP